MGLCIVLGICCILYYLAIIIYAGITADFAWFWLVAGAAFLIGGFIIRYGTHHPGLFPSWLRYVVLGVLTAGLIVFTVICGGIAKGMLSSGSNHLDYVVVLGAQVKGSVPSKALDKRLQRAYAYAVQNEDTKLILSGGQGSGEDITEAQCMKDYLLTRGIKEDRLILEEKSTSTRENLQFSMELTGCQNASVGIITNNFHVFRAVKLAKKLGYTDVTGIAADSDLIMQMHYIVREAAALVKEKMMGNI